MSVHKDVKKVTTHVLQEMKNRGEKISMLTGYEEDISMSHMLLTLGKKEFIKLYPEFSNSDINDKIFKLN